MYTHRVTNFRNWHTELWRLKRPNICHLQAGDPVKPMVKFNPSLEGWEWRSLWFQSKSKGPRTRSPRAGENGCLSSGREQIHPSFTSLFYLYAGQEATVRNGHGTTDWFQIGKGIHQGCILSPCLFNLYAEHIMRNTGLEEAQAGIKIAGRNINNLRYVDDTTLWQKVKRN